MKIPALTNPEGDKPLWKRSALYVGVSALFMGVARLVQGDALMTVVAEMGPIVMAAWVAMNRLPSNDPRA